MQDILKMALWGAVQNSTDSATIGQQNPKLLGIQDTHNIAAALHQEALHLYRTEKML